MEKTIKTKHIIINDHFQNFKTYVIPRAQLIIADVPYNIGNNAYASNPAWYVNEDNKNGESSLAGKQFFDTDKDFRPAEFMHFCSQMLKPERKDANLTVRPKVKRAVQPHLAYGSEKWREIWHSEPYELSLKFLYELFFEKAAG